MCSALLCAIHQRCIARSPARRIVCTPCLEFVSEEERRVQEDFLLLACPREVATDQEAQAGQSADRCPGCGAGGRTHRCHQCGDMLCGGCVNQLERCYMCDGAYPGAPSEERAFHEERGLGDPTQVLVSDGGNSSYHLHFRDPMWCRRFCLYCGVFRRAPLMQLFTSLLTVPASTRAWFTRRGE